MKMDVINLDICFPTQ